MHQMAIPLPMLINYIAQSLLFFCGITFGQNSQLEICHGLCFCSSQESVVDCSPQDRVQYLPTKLPPGTTKLIIQGGIFPAPGHLRRKNLTGLNYLISLKIINSQLRSIEPHAFLGMTNLRHLDLSLNQLQRLEENTFYGLKLTNLYLQEQNLPKNDEIVGSTNGLAHSNVRLYLDDEVFTGMSAVQINLFRNSISEIPFSLFSKVSGLEKLILSSNNITKLDTKYSHYFDKHDRLIDLTDNPLLCSCNLAWLASRVKEWISYLPSLNTTCLHQSVFLSDTSSELSQPEVIPIELRKLSTIHLCAKSKIHSVGIEMSSNASTATISCTAVALNSLDDNLYDSTNMDVSSYHGNVVVGLHPPSVAWKYIEAGQLRQVSWMKGESVSGPSSERPSTLNKGDMMTTVQLNISLTQSQQHYTCVTWDEMEYNHEIVVTIRGPDERPDIQHVPSQEGENSLDTKVNNVYIYSASGNKTVSKIFTNNVEADHFTILLKKQYTLLEMIGAILGTFLFTLTLLILCSRCMLFFKRQDFGLLRNAHSLILVDSKDVQAINNSFDKHVPSTIELYTESTRSNTVKNKKTENNESDNRMYEFDKSVSANIYPNCNPYFGHNSLAAHPLCLQASSILPRSNYPFPGSTTLSTPVRQSEGEQTNILFSGFSGYWPMAPGSTYSVPGSHEYDVPRNMQISQIPVDQPVNPGVQIFGFHDFVNSSKN